MREIKFSGYNGYELNVAIWDDVAQPKGVIQILHGMVEHIGRYDDFATFLNERGYIVIGDDHRGHGKTAQNRLGIIPIGDCFQDSVQDGILLGQYAIKTYRLPLILFGHSYGSFLAQRYIQLASNNLSAVILSGSACKNTCDIKVASIIANTQYAICGKDKRAQLLKKLSFDRFDDEFLDENENVWLTRDKAKRQEYIDDPLCNYTMSIGFYKSLFDALKKLYDKQEMSNIRKDLPIFIISGDNDPVGQDGKLVKRLHALYQKYDIQDVDIKLYRDARHELLNEINRAEVYRDIVSFVDKYITHCDAQ